ncbi:hypothetical protein BNJ_00374 [Kaumoebavirus]|uniref:hypothetical protein n=1 Tax=Kaumoebavirus TaxID=1859492 RepID=UPI0009C22122|nr:hypothetical protein BNJ_00374 [Kaumoebavirus]ARA72194.1 hypothetical protein BNJ_00374 [Kaumoebavirus]
MDTKAKIKNDIRFITDRTDLINILTIFYRNRCDIKECADGCRIDLAGVPPAVLEQVHVYISRKLTEEELVN